MTTQQPSAPSPQLPQINVRSRTIQSCFSDCIYQVPEFQRPYSWEDEQLNDYWDDVVLAQGELFFGTIVTWVSEQKDLFRDTHSLIDGQQRLTTSTIALSVVRDVLGGIAESTQADAPEAARKRAHTLHASSQKYLLTDDDYGNTYPIVRRSESMFWEHIQNPDAIPSKAAWDESARRIGDARHFFEDKTLEYLDGTTSVDERIDRLTELRDNILRARLIQVELQKEEDAFLIFETLNTRGADLQLRDLIKNELVRGAGAQTNDRQAMSDRWHRVMQQVVPDNAAIEAADNFIWQSWNSRRKTVKKGELYKALKDSLREGGLTHTQYLEELEKDANTYCHFETDSSSFPEKDGTQRSALTIPQVQDSIRALAIFNVSVANSAVLALVRNFDSSKNMRQKDLIRGMRAIENFHFQYTYLASSGSTGGTRSRYNTFATQLSASRTQNEYAEAIDDLISRLKESLPSPSTTVPAFRKTFYAPRLTLTRNQKKRGDQQIVRYILLTLAREGNNITRSRLVSDWSIEHIRPQGKASLYHTDPTFSIGNLTLLTPDANTEAGNKNFESKKPLLKRHAALKDETLWSWLENDAKPDLSDDDIAERGKKLAEYAVHKVWTVG